MRQMMRFITGQCSQNRPNPHFTGCGSEILHITEKNSKGGNFAASPCTEIFYKIHKNHVFLAKENVLN